MSTKIYTNEREAYRRIVEPRVFHESDVPLVGRSWGTRANLLGEVAFYPARNFELRVQHYCGTKDPAFKGNHEAHHHTRCESFMFVLRGKGVSLIEGKEYPLEPGTVVYMPPNVEHVDKNTSETEELTILLCFVPFGNEPNSLGQIVY